MHTVQQTIQMWAIKEEIKATFLFTKDYGKKNNKMLQKKSK